MILTADLCDAHEADIAIALPVFREYGNVKGFHGRVVTLRLHEDNLLLRQTIEKPGEGRVVVIDGGGSLRRALIGGNLATLAHKNGWAGLVFNGLVRDVAELAEVPMGIRALGSTPLRPRSEGYGERDVPVQLPGVVVRPGDYLYADEDGMIVSSRELA
ncbi:MAG TPA: ribonuclease E activity regulator RraA [Devosia sp.]|nr:ribonuclease E activity regulator RraA [Devosia sp.]